MDRASASPTIHSVTNANKGPGSPGVSSSRATSAAATAVTVLASGGFGYLLTTFLFAFSGGQARMVSVVNLVDLIAFVATIAAGTMVWLLRSPADVVKWAVIAAAIVWFAAIVLEFVLSFSLGA